MRTVFRFGDIQHIPHILKTTAVKTGEHTTQYNKEECCTVGVNKDLQTRLCLHLQLFTADSKPAAFEIIPLKLLYLKLFHLVRKHIASVVKIVFE